MPSSTSSSDSRLPSGSYVRIWFLCGLTCIAILGSAELSARKESFLPDVSDTMELWHTHRDRVYGADRIVILGTSRAQVGIDPSVLARELPGHDVVFLPISASWPFPVLKDLCEDEEFNGLIFCETTAEMIQPAEEGRSRTALQYVKQYHDSHRTGGVLNRRLNTLIGAFLQDTFAIQSHGFMLETLASRRFRNDRNYLHMNRHRHRPAWYSERMSPVERERHREGRIQHRRDLLEEAPTLKEFERLCSEELKPLSRKLRKRGGGVILVRMPTTGEHWTMDERITPRNLFWDRIEELTGIGTIHFLDYPELSRFECPDTSHIDAKDAGDFTRGLAVILRKVIENPVSSRPVHENP